MVVVIGEMHDGWKKVVAIELQLNCTKVELYIQGVIFLATHATCLVTWV
jgi:hypothetical protein